MELGIKLNSTNILEWIFESAVAAANPVAGREVSRFFADI
jgi:hypothetical protein